MRVLAERWPENLAWPDLLAQAMARCPLRAEERAAAADLLRADLLKGYGLGLVGLHSMASACTATPGERPRASHLARHQSGSSSVVTTLRHRQVTLDNAARELLVWADGSRDRAELQMQLNVRFPALPAEAFSKLLTGLAQSGLMSA
jgi:hypothetical protein